MEKMNTQESSAHWKKRHKGLEDAEVSLLPGTAGRHQNNGVLQHLLILSVAHHISRQRSRAGEEESFSSSEPKNSDFVKHPLKKVKRCEVQFSLLSTSGTDHTEVLKQ